MCLCKFCTSEKVGDEEHFLMDCKAFSTKRACFKGKMSSIIPNFLNMSKTNQLKTILCPTSSAATKIVNKYIRIMFLARENIEEGNDSNELNYPTMPVNYNSTDYDNFSDIDEWEEFDSFISESDLDPG